MKKYLRFDKNWYNRIKSIVGKKIRSAIKNRDFEEMYWLQQCRRSFLQTYTKHIGSYNQTEVTCS